MRVVRWTRSGLADAARILAYIDRVNPRAAQDLAAEIGSKTARLPRFPFIGRPGYDPTTRELFIKRSDVVVYRVWPDAVEILQIWHVAQDRSRRPREN